MATPVKEECIGELLEIGRPPVCKTKNVQYNLEEGEFSYQKAYYNY